MRRWDGVHQHRMTAKRLQLEADALQDVTVRIECLRFRWIEMQRQRNQQSLRRTIASLKRSEEAFIQDPLVRSMLIEQYHAVVMLKQDVRVTKLNRIQLRCILWSDRTAELRCIACIRRRAASRFDCPACSPMSGVRWRRRSPRDPCMRLRAHCRGAL